MAKLRADPVTAAPRGKLWKNIDGIRRHQPPRHDRREREPHRDAATKNKKARNLSVSGPLVRELGRASA
jgi:hypothetical protein